MFASPSPGPPGRPPRRLFASPSPGQPWPGGQPSPGALRLAAQVPRYYNLWGRGRRSCGRRLLIFAARIVNKGRLMSMAMYKRVWLSGCCAAAKSQHNTKYTRGPAGGVRASAQQLSRAWGAVSMAMYMCDKWVWLASGCCAAAKSRAAHASRWRAQQEASSDAAHCWLLGVEVEGRGGLD